MDYFLYDNGLRRERVKMLVVYSHVVVSIWWFSTFQSQSNHVLSFKTIFNISHYRSSHQSCSIKKVFLKISQNLQENTCAWVSCRQRPTTLLKKRLWHRCFPVNFTKFLRTPFFNRTPLVTASVKVESIFRIKPLHVNEAILCIVLQELSMNFQFYFDEFSNSYVKHKNLQLARNYIAEWWFCYQTEIIVTLIRDLKFLI